MSTWIDGYAARLEGSEEPGGFDEEGILELAGIVAHGTERKNAPVAAFLAGRYVARREREGASAAEAFAEARRIAEDLLAGGAPEG